MLPPPTQEMQHIYVSGSISSWTPQPCNIQPRSWRQGRVLVHRSLLSLGSGLKYTILTHGHIGKERQEGHTNIPSQCFFLFQQMNIQNCTGRKPESSCTTLLRNWQIRFLSSPTFFFFFLRWKYCREPALRKTSIKCVVVAILMWRQDDILYLKFIYSLSNILHAFSLHLHFPLRA